VGLGPGDRDLLTPQAGQALQDSQVVVGYRTYLELIEDLLKDKEIISSGMRGEVDRAQKAVQKAQEGKTVAVVSSGDPGIYGMAGVVLEAAPEDLPVKVLPGVTAASAAASCLGAPLMHDFAVISLSNLLTPWEKIQRRLEAAGWGDYGVVLYNPRSKGRTEHLTAAREILLRYRPRETPVGIVRNAYRGEEASQIITTLREMPEEEIDMLTVVVVGNSETRTHRGLMITPRGYSL